MKRCGFITVLGETNAGKSTLVNKIVGQKVSIVSRKRQTTLNKITGIAVYENSQIIFVDTPGFLREKKAENLERIAWNAFRENDITVFVVDASKKKFDSSLSLLCRINNTKKVILVLNKIDLVQKTHLLQIIDEFRKARDFLDIFMISALKNDGLEKLKHYLAGLMPKGNWLYNDDEATDMPFEEYVTEITREHLYDQVHQEVPYQCTIITRSYEKTKKHRLKIYQDICVKSKSQKGIIIGHNASKIKSIGIASREELSRLLKCKVDLFLNVIVNSNNNAYKE